MRRNVAIGLLGVVLAAQAAPLLADGPHFRNCTEARAAGYSNIPRGAPGYAPKLDRDNDGIACES